MKKFASPFNLIMLFWILLAILFAFADQRVSKALYDPSAAWAHTMEAFGQVPGSLLGVISAGVLLRVYKFKSDIKSIAGGLGLVLLAIFTGFGVSADLLGAQVDPENLNVVMLLVLSLAIPLVTQLVLRRFAVDQVSEYKNAAKAGLLLMILGGIVTVWLFKIPWGRWTYRDILEAGDLSLFTPWFLPQGVNGHHSFFSGHTALSFVVVGYAFFLQKYRSIRDIVLVLAVIWGVIGAISRIVVGAHFASDVLFGAGETIMWAMYLGNKFVIKEQKTE